MSSDSSSDSDSSNLSGGSLSWLSDSLSENSSSSEEEESVISSKRLKIYHNNDGIDRISELPDVILHHIISFIDMKDVVRNTSKVSRRWRYLWESLSFLNFDHSLWHKQSNKMNSFIDKVLLRRDDIIIKKLCMSLKTGYDDVNRIDDWLIAVIKRNVEEVHLDVHMVRSKSLPDLIFKSDIQVFKLHCSANNNNIYNLNVMRLPKSVCLAPKLKVLDIYNVVLPKGDSNKELVLGCVSLENLSVHFCYHKHIGTLHICAPQLKNLLLENGARCKNGFCTLQISTPNLKSLVLRGSLYKDYSLEQVSSIECAKFESPAVVDADMLVKVLDGLRNAKALEFSGETELISARPLDISDQLIHPFDNLRFLKINGWSCSSWIPTIHYLLTNSYGLEALSLRMNVVTEAKNWGELFQCIHRLKSIEIKGLKGCEDELKFFEFVLKNAGVLQYLKLYIHERCLPFRKEDELAEFNMKIHSLPRASSNVKILPFILT